MVVKAFSFDLRKPWLPPAGVCGGDATRLAGLELLKKDYLK